MNTETLLIVALAVGGAMWWQSRQAPRYVPGPDGSRRYQPSNPESGVTPDFGVGYDMPDWLFGVPEDDTQLRPQVEPYTTRDFGVSYGDA